MVRVGSIPESNPESGWDSSPKGGLEGGLEGHIAGRMNVAMQGPAGFFGKVTSHGDFVARRLTPAFQGPWDVWLQAGLKLSKATLGTSWLATYLNSPIWRFALAPGVCGDAGMAGLLMPSVDRVGRHFPLTLACALDVSTPIVDCAMLQDGWYGQLEALALSSLRKDFSLDAFDAALYAVVMPGSTARTASAAYLAGTSGGTQSATFAATSVATSSTVIPLDTVHSFAEVHGTNSTRAMDARQGVQGIHGLRAIADAALVGQCLWWTDGSPKVPPCMLVSRALPPPAAFAALLDGDWQCHGWPGA